MGNGIEPLVVNEVFYSLQGEGARAGCPSVFVRLAGCDLACGFCDTDFSGGVPMRSHELLSAVAAYPCRWIVFTGGEPMRQLTRDWIDVFRCAGYKIQVETNGNHECPSNITHLTVSPKVAEHAVKPAVAQELRYVRAAGQSLPVPSCSSPLKFLSPVFDGDVLPRENLEWCVKLCKENPEWRLSVQMHKAWKIR